MAGTISPTQASIKSPELMPFEVRLNSSFSLRRPPKNIASPTPSSRFPMMDPVMAALTTSCRPALSANSEIISSGALPIVAASKPPRVGPIKTEILSAALPNKPANGTMARPEHTKIRVGSASNQSRHNVTGMKSKRRFRLMTFPDVN